jgi:hypothetical protein
MLGKQCIPAIAQITAKKRSKLYGYDFFFTRVQWEGRRLPLRLIVHKLAGVGSDKFAEMAHLLVFHRSK